MEILGTLLVGIAGFLFGVVWAALRFRALLRSGRLIVGGVTYRVTVAVGDAPDPTKESSFVRSLQHAMDTGVFDAAIARANNRNARRGSVG